MFGVSRQNFSGKGPGQIIPEKHCKLAFRYMTFCFYWNQLLGDACMKRVRLWDETLIKLSYKQAWMLLRSGSLMLLKF